MTYSQHWRLSYFLSGREDEFPLLVRATRDAQDAITTRIEWIVESIEDGALRRDVWTNYTQIFRAPSPNELLAAMERQIEYGVPVRDLNDWRSDCGGYRHYLGRDLADDDVLILRPLQGRELFRLVDNADEPADWITEFSLQVQPGASALVAA